MSAFYNSLYITLPLLVGNVLRESKCTKEGPCTRSKQIHIILMRYFVSLAIKPKH